MLCINSNLLLVHLLPHSLCSPTSPPPPLLLLSFWPSLCPTPPLSLSLFISFSYQLITPSPLSVYIIPPFLSWHITSAHPLSVSSFSCSSSVCVHFLLHAMYEKLQISANFHGGRLNSVEICQVPYTTDHTVSYTYTSNHIYIWANCHGDLSKMLSL